MDFAIALCSKKDSFCKKKGRIISEGRLSKWLENDQFTHHKLVYSITVPENVRFLTSINDTVINFVSGTNDFANEVMENTEYCNLKDVKKLKITSDDFRKAIEEIKTQKGDNFKSEIDMNKILKSLPKVEKKEFKNSSKIKAFKKKKEIGRASCRERV